MRRRVHPHPVARLRRFLTEPDRGPERNPDERHPLETLEDWILFGPRRR